MMTTLSGGAPEQDPRWDLVDTESCGGGIRFLAPYLIVWGYVGIYRRKEYVGGATWGPRGWRARLPPWVRPPTSWPPRCFLDVHSKSPGFHLFQKRSSRRFHYVWILFDIPVLRNTEIGKKTAICTGPLIRLRRIYFSKHFYPCFGLYWALFSTFILFLGLTY